MRILPQSLVSRVFALYAATLLAFVGTGLGVLHQYEFRQHGATAPPVLHWRRRATLPRSGRA
jgi:hypothetical protein